MKESQYKELKKELKSVGARENELDGLLSIARNLDGLHQKNNKQKNGWHRLIPIGFASVSGLVLGMVLFIYSQTVLPNSWLFPAQKLTDNLAVSIDANYRGNVMMKRAQEVKQLVNVHASPKVILATLADYQSEAQTYKSMTKNYAAFEYCKNNLQQAAANASGSEQQAINKSLTSLSNV